MLKNLKLFKAKSIVLLDQKNTIVGHSLIYNDGKGVLYFGYFGVIDHDPIKISKIIDELIKFAEINNFRLIRGPINVPTYIYGWGFMKEGSSEELYITKPVNPPIYQQIFLKKGFYIKHEEISWEGRLLKLNPWNLKQYDFSDYEYFYPKDKDEIMKLKEKFLKIHADSLPPSSKITPNVEEIFKDLVDFVFKYGHNFMFSLIRHKPSGKIIACGSFLPNPFRKDKNGNYNSIVAHSWAVDKEHRRKGLSMLMTGAASLHFWKNKIRYASGHTGSENEKSINAAKKLGTKSNRWHLILEYKV